MNTCSVRDKAEDKVYSLLGTLARAQGAAPGHHHRRGRLRGQPGRRGDHRARALRRPGVRAADHPPPAARCWRSCVARAAADRREFPGDREIRSPAGATRRGASGIRFHHGRLQQVLQLLRGALYARRGSQPSGRVGARGSAQRWWRRASARSRCWARTSMPTKARAPGGAPMDLGAADPRDQRDAGCRAHPLHDLASAEFRRHADRGLRAHAQARQPHAPAGAERFGSHPRR